jgi:hypothetical protein
MTLLDGRERTEADLLALFSRTGLNVNRVVQTRAMGQS